MIMAYWKFIIFMALFASNANELANWQLTVPAKEHISSYQIVSDNWKIHYSINVSALPTELTGRLTAKSILKDKNLAVK